MSESLKVFITYSHRDKAAKNTLIDRLAVMRQQGLITIWHDNEILPGDRWYEDISKNLADSDILFYLVSASSLASENCNKELAEALDINVKVIPIILEDCDWQNHQLGCIEALPNKGKPINEWQPESKGWQNVVDGIRIVVSEIQSHIKPAPRITDEEIGILAYWALQQGNFLMMLEQMDKAIEAYSRAIEHNPSDTTAYTNRGIAYVNNGAHDLAIADYNKAIDLNSDDDTAYNNRGAVYLSKGVYDRAIEDFSKAIALNPVDATAYNNRGIAYYGIGAYDRAIEDHNKAIALNSDYANAYNNRGIAYYGKGAYDRAIEDHNKAIALNSDYDAYNNRGNAYQSAGVYDRAIEDFSKAIALNPVDATAYSNRGNAYRDKGEPDRAIEDHNKAIELNPDDATAYNNRGNVYSDKGTYNRAIADFDRAIKLNPNYVLAYYNRGSTYQDKGEIVCAIADYSKVIDLNPNYAVAYYNRGEAWLRVRKWNKAKTDLIVAKSRGVDIIKTFCGDYQNVEEFERRYGVNLPEDIAAMLTQE